MDKLEKETNMKASGYTSVILGALLVLFLFVKWTLPTVPPPPMEEGMEVNLGNSDFGLGDDQPFLPGQPSPANEQAYTPPTPTTTAVNDAQDFETDDQNEDAPELSKPEVTKPKSNKVPDKELVKTKPNPTPKPTAAEAPPQPKPKAQMKGVGGDGTGGNDADTYKKGGNEGVKGGVGDQGRPGGDPNSTNYEGGGKGNSGVAISRGLAGRRFTSLPSFQDDFNENAKVAMDIKVDASGKVISASYQPRGSTTSNAGMQAIAKKKALQIKFNPAEIESAGTIIFNFRLKN